MKQIVFLCLILIGQITSAKLWDGRIFRAADQTEITFNEFLASLLENQIVVMGENHVTAEIQTVEAKIIKEIVASSPKPWPWALAWEFIAYSQQERVNTLFEQFRKGDLSGDEFVRQIVGSPKNFTYIPVLDQVAKSGGKLIGINLTRAQKAPVTQGGIKAADPQIIPTGYEIGGPNYFERFKKQMQTHTTPDKLLNYFDAQCLTDDVMAYQVGQISGVDKVLVIAGHFHTDFYDGFVHRLQVRLPSKSMVVVRIVDASEFREDELLDQMHHPKYGQLADFVYFVKEPLKTLEK